MRKYGFKVDVELVMMAEGSCPADAWDKVAEEILKLNGRVLKVGKKEIKENENKEETKVNDSFIINRFLKVL